MKKVVTRFPPSPTGEIHIGNMRTMLFNFAFAKHHGGEVVLRFEDTDIERSDPKFEPLAVEALSALGLTFDHGPFRQSERTARYADRLRALIASGAAYEGEESSDGSGRRVIRFRNPNRPVAFDDIVRGRISIDSSMFEDFVIARNIDNPIYHFAVVVDDIDMEITHVIRGEDHITSTPRQILLIEALGGEVPVYAHLPLIVGPDRKKLSKRHGSVSVNGFLRQGYLPEALVNYLALLGWNPGTDKEFFTLEEFVAEFSLERVGKNPAIFDYDKLAHINRAYMQRMPERQYEERLLPFLSAASRELFLAYPQVSRRLIERVIRERCNIFGDIAAMEEAGELLFYFNRPYVALESLPFKDDTLQETRTLLAETGRLLAEIPDAEWTIETIQGAVGPWSEKVGRGKILHPMRTALSGRKQSPDPFTIAYVVGKEETLARLRQ